MRMPAFSTLKCLIKKSSLCLYTQSINRTTSQFRHMRWTLLFLLVITACSTVEQASSPISTNPVSTPAPVQQTITPEAKLPQDIPIPIVQPEPSVEVIKQNNAPPGKIPCMDDCQNRCDERAQIACTQKERAGCRASCGETIENSACVQACTFLSRPDVCKQQFEKFCGAQCASESY